MADLKHLQDQFNRHPLIVQARLDGYEIQFCPADGDIWISFPRGTRVPDGLDEDDLFEHPSTRGKGCAEAAQPYKPIGAAMEDTDVLQKLIETLSDEQKRRVGVGKSESEL